MSAKTSTFLMFDGAAEEAMNFYVSLFEGATVEAIRRYGADEAGPEGSVMVANFSINGQNFMCIDSPAEHDFGFTPAISIFVDCETAGEIAELYEKLSQGGETLMPLGDYQFSQAFAWVADRFGVSWQLNLPQADEPDTSGSAD